MGRRAWAWGRPLVGVLVLALCVQRLGFGPFLDGLRGVGPGTLVAAIAIGWVTTICSAWRWRVVAGAVGTGLPLSAATASYYRSQFLNSVLPGGVLGDVHRGVRHGQDAGDLGRGVRAVVWERVAGQVVQVAIALVVLLILPSPVRSAIPRVALVGVVAAGILLLTCRAVMRHGPGRLAGALHAAAGEGRRALLHRTTWPPVLLASSLVVVGHLGMFLLAASAAGASIPLPHLLPLALVVLLAAAIPLNVGGWGPREGAAAWIFAATGWGAATGAATATAFGVLSLVAVFPGVVVLVVDRRHPTVRHSEPEDARREPVAEVVLSGSRQDGAAHG